MIASAPPASRPYLKRIAASRLVRAVAPVGAPALLILALTWPMLFTNAEFNEDWIRHLWYIWRQSLAISENHAPSLFLNYSGSVFYPEYAFYGGTLYALLGGISLALGEAPLETYVLTYLAAFAAAYGGWYWIARIAGLGRWGAQAPGLVFVTSSYYLTLIYGRGDLQELLAVSTIPLIVASGLSVLRAERLAFGPALALAASSVLFFGSHSLTMVWGTTFLAFTTAAALACVPQTRRWFAWRRVLRVASLVVPALLLNAWFLLPAAVYQSHTAISSHMDHWRLELKTLMYLVSASRLFTLSRATQLKGDFALSLPVVAIAWSLVSVVLYGRAGLRSPWYRALLVFTAITALVTLLMTHATVVLSLPKPYAILQYAYRLETYVVLGVCATLVAALALARRARGRARLWALALIPVALISVVGAVQQTDAYVPGSDRHEVFQSRTGEGEIGLLDYLDFNLPLVSPAKQPVELAFQSANVHHQRLSEVVHAKPHQIVYSNLGAGPEFIRLEGARIVGRTVEGYDVLEIEPPAADARAAAAAAGRSAPTEVVTVSAAGSLPVVLGRWISLLGALALVANFATLAIRRARRAS